MPCADTDAMAAKRYEDLVVWQIADELRQEVLRLTEHHRAASDFRFRDQLRQAAGGIPTNIAEGFRRLSAGEFVQFLRYAFASAGETAEWISDGVARKHWSDSDVAAARLLLRRLNPPLLALIRYLRTPQAKSRSAELAKGRKP